MRNIFLLMAIAFIILVSCDNRKRFYADYGADSDKLRDFVFSFVEKINIKEPKSLVDFYPDIEKSDSLHSGFSPDSINIYQVDDSLYDARLNSSTWLRIAIDSLGNFKVNESFGLFAFDEKMLFVARETGLFDPKVPDTELSERLKDNDFYIYLNKIVEQRLDSIILIDVERDEELNTNFMEALKTPGMMPQLYITLKNNTDSEILSTEFNFLIEKKFSILLEEGMVDEKWEEEESGSRIAPGDSIVRYYDYGPNIMFYFKGLTYNLNREQLIRKFIKFTGWEYSQYQAEKDQKKISEKKRQSAIGEDEDEFDEIILRKISYKNMDDPKSIEKLKNFSPL